MFCKNCGNKINEGEMFCSVCGAKATMMINPVNPFVSRLIPPKNQSVSEPHHEKHICPNCGANITNTYNCEFCGSLLVRFVEAGINIDSISEYTSDAHVFNGMQEELDKHLAYKKRNPNEYVQTNINNNIMVIVSTKSLTDFDGRPFFEKADVDGLGICLWFKRENEEERIQLERFKELKSFSLFTHRITRRQEIVGFDKEHNAISQIYTYDEYAIDFGLDSKSAARFCSEIIAEVYNLSRSSNLVYLTETQSDKEREHRRLEEEMNSSGNAYIICINILVLVVFVHFYFCVVSESEFAALITWICFAVEIVLGVIEEKQRSKHKKCRFALNK